MSIYCDLSCLWRRWIYMEPSFPIKLSTYIVQTFSLATHYCIRPPTHSIYHVLLVSVTCFSLYAMFCYRMWPVSHNIFILKLYVYYFNSIEHSYFNSWNVWSYFKFRVWSRSKLVEWLKHLSSIFPFYIFTFIRFTFSFVSKEHVHLVLIYDLLRKMTCSQTLYSWNV